MTTPPPCPIDGTHLLAALAGFGLALALDWLHGLAVDHLNGRQRRS